jgi:signal transduction histidine kinase
VEEQIGTRTILVVTGEAAFARRVISRLTGKGTAIQLPIAVSLAQARAQLQALADVQPRENLSAILLEESATSDEQWATAVYELARAAPLVIVSRPQRLEMLLRPTLAGGPSERGSAAEPHDSLTALLAAGDVEWLPQSEAAAELAVALLRRHAHRVGQPLAAPRPAHPPAVIEFNGETREFAEVLRHEVNNPLTGILGNAELLLARRGRLPEAVIARLETIADLAVRLRETVRRISAACELGAPPLSPPAAASSKTRPRLIR